VEAALYCVDAATAVANRFSRVIDWLSDITAQVANFFVVVVVIFAADPSNQRSNATRT
jgi:hypothetical protein